MHVLNYNSNILQLYIVVLLYIIVFAVEVPLCQFFSVQVLRSFKVDAVWRSTNL